MSSFSNAAMAAPAKTELSNRTTSMTERHGSVSIPAVARERCAVMVSALALLMGHGPAARGQEPDSLVEPVTGMEFVLVQAGSFVMGRNFDGAVLAEEPEHPVTLSRDVYFARFEVTQRQWQAIMMTNPSWHATVNGFDSCPECPVEQVTWHDADEFLERFRIATGLNARLPTEAEWEYAARGGVNTRGYTYAGSDVLETVAWYNGNSDARSHPVGTRAPNELGLHDMSGNVYEWVADTYNTYSAEAVTDPTGRPNVYRVFRGGSWYLFPSYCRSVHRRAYLPTYRSKDLGFRVVVDP